MSADAPLAFLAKVLARIATAHSPRTLAKQLASAFDEHAAITRLALPAVAIARTAHGWTIHDAAGAGLQPLVPGLAIAARGPLPTYFASPAFVDALARVIETALRHVELVQRLATVSRTSHAKRRALHDALERAEPGHGIVARSAVMQDAMARVQLVARHPTTVLLTGESGTGKELIARELHRLSPRAHRPFLQLNCAAIPQALVESELFGHERGAFTGAERTHPGVFERANGGTLLLDEIGELAPEAQAKLLRVLQERSLRRVGGTADLSVDVRVIAATHRDLRAMLAGARFREDLYYRLAIFQIEVPPLRDRHGDLAPLAAALGAELAAKLGVPSPALSPDDLERIEAYTWPGNVRELRNVLETAVIVGELPADFASSAARPRSAPAASLHGALRDAIESALRATRGKIYGRDGAAAHLGLPPATLQSKMKKLGIARRHFT